MVQIQMVGGLVGQPEAGGLGQYRGHGHPLAFAAGERVHQAVAQVGHVQRGQRGLGAGVVVGPFHLPQGKVGVAAYQRGLQHRGGKAI